MSKIFTALVLASFMVFMPAQAGVVTGEFVCNTDLTVINMTEVDGVVTGELVSTDGVVTSDELSCDNGATVGNVTQEEAGYIGVVTGE